jgi:hypothetical protein
MMISPLVCQLSWTRAQRSFHGSPRFTVRLDPDTNGWFVVVG